MALQIHAQSGFQPFVLPILLALVTTTSASWKYLQHHGLVQFATGTENSAQASREEDGAPPIYFGPLDAFWATLLPSALLAGTGAQLPPACAAALLFASPLFEVADIVSYQMELKLGCRLYWTSLSRSTVEGSVAAIFCMTVCLALAATLSAIPGNIDLSVLSPLSWEGLRLLVPMLGTLAVQATTSSNKKLVTSFWFLSMMVVFD